MDAWNTSRCVCKAFIKRVAVNLELYLLFNSTSPNYASLVPLWKFFPEFREEHSIYYILRFYWPFTCLSINSFPIFAFMLNREIWPRSSPVRLPAICHECDIGVADEYLPNHIHAMIWSTVIKILGWFLMATHRRGQYDWLALLLVYSILGGYILWYISEIGQW
jgi:hypothetical protein